MWFLAKAVGSMPFLRYGATTRTAHHDRPCHRHSLQPERVDIAFFSVGEGLGWNICARRCKSRAGVAVAYDLGRPYSDDWHRRLHGLRRHWSGTGRQGFWILRHLKEVPVGFAGRTCGELSAAPAVSWAILKRSCHCPAVRRLWSCLRVRRSPSQIGNTCEKVFGVSESESLPPPVIQSMTRMAGLQPYGSVSARHAFLTSRWIAVNLDAAWNRLRGSAGRRGLR